MKPLPKAPRKNICDFLVVDPRANNKCILKRMKRVNLESVLGDRSLAATPSAYATARSAYVNPNEQLLPPPTQDHSQQTLQERRNASSIPQLTLPTNDDGTTRTTQGGLPMIWLADEQMWLVADPSDPGYGYYATGPEDGADEWLPPYTEAESPASDPSSSDLSPIREQFLSLIDAGSRRNSPNYPTSSNPTEPRLSPLFQEAVQGVGMLDLSSPSDYQVSPFSPPQPHSGRQPQNSRNSNQRQYIPYRPVPEFSKSYTQSHSHTKPQTHRSSTQKTPQPDLYLESWSPSPHGRSPSPNNPLFPPRSTSHALRITSPQPDTTNWGKYSSEAEIRRQQERKERRRGALAREQSHQSRRERPDSCYSDSGLSTYTTSEGGLDVGPSPGYWGVQRASSARH
ncbi:hypothetical protein MMC10_000154 [Thelotrema lepadinum]|nr:hypothetical protein [Thelotrema lepadinum]